MDGIKFVCFMYSCNILSNKLFIQRLQPFILPLYEKNSMLVSKVHLELYA